MIGILGAVACEHNKAFGPPPCTKPNLGGRSEMNIAIPLALVASAALRRLVCRFRDLHRRGSRKVGQGDSSRKHQAGVKQAIPLPPPTCCERGTGLVAALDSAFLCS